MKLRLLATALVVAATAWASVPAARAADTYIIDTMKQHAFVEFRIKHLGYSWMYGRFNDFEGQFSLDPEQPANSSVRVEIDTASIDTNNAERDKHLRSKDFLNVEEHPKATFVSTSIEPTGDKTAVIKGDLTLNGVTKPVEIQTEEIGQGKDPWGGYRAGFLGTTTITLADFDIDYDLGPASRTVDLTLSIEGVRQ
ncbi:MAG: YceI family protein [Rhodospirillales bacterium]|nr:YceI family protein [Rhodospirillales bacterium]